MASDKKNVVMDHTDSGVWKPFASNSSSLGKGQSCVQPLPHQLPTWSREREGSGPLTGKVFSRVLNEAAANHPSFSQCSSHLHINPICQNQNPEKKVMKDRTSKSIK